MKLKITAALVALTLSFSGCRDKTFDYQAALDVCHGQVEKSLAAITDTSLIPRNIDAGDTEWELVSKISDWTSGFWPGILWYDYESTGDEYVRNRADYYTEKLRPLSESLSGHDIGFQMMCSFGNAYRITGEETYKQPLLDAAQWLAYWYNPRVGTILSWESMVEPMGWPHNTIIDNMMNLELLFWAARNGGGRRLYDIAVEHSRKTMRNNFRDDWTNYHVAVYDTISGNFIKGVTHQGYADHTMWARGQSWGIYGFTVAYRESGEEEFLEAAQNIADVYLERLPEDMIPYWDFDAPDIPNAPRDASAASITASALLELSTLVGDGERSGRYLTAAVNMLKRLSSGQYSGCGYNNAFIRHCVGHLPNGYELDSSIVYGDYYYIEALVRLKRLSTGQGVNG